MRPQSSIILSGEELVRRGFRTLGSALRYVAGAHFQLTSRGARYGMRGIPDGLIVVLDGVPLVVDGEQDHLDVDAGLDLHDVERIEVIRGPASVINGASALSGVVRVSSKRPGLTGGQVRLGGTHIGEREFGGEGTWRHDRWAVRAVASHREGAVPPWRLEAVPTRFIVVGPATVPSTKEDRSVPRRDDEATVARLVAEWGELIVDVSAQRILEFSPVSSFSHGLVEERPQLKSRERYRARARWQGDLLGLRLSAALSGARERRRDRIVLYPPRGAFPEGGEVRIRGSSDNAALWLRADVPLGAHHRLVLGGFGDLTDLAAVTDAVDPVDGDRTRGLVRFDDTTGTLNGALEYQGDLGNGWHVTAGLALRWHTGFSTGWAPRAAIVYFPDPTWSLRMAFAEGVRTPDRFDMVALSQAVVAGAVTGARANDDLAPEHVRSLEVGAHLEPTSALRFDIGGYVTRHADALELESRGNALSTENLEDRTVVGGEAVAVFDLAAHALLVEVGFGYARTEKGPALTDDLLSVFGSAVVQPHVWWQDVPEGAQLGVRGLSNHRPDSSRTAGTVDAFLAFETADRSLLLRLAARNLLDGRESFEDPEASPVASPLEIPTPGRTLYFSLEGRL